MRSKLLIKSAIGTGIDIGEVLMMNREMGVLVDSGTSFTYVYAKAFYKLMQVFKTESKKMNAPLHLEQRVSGVCFHQ